MDTLHARILVTGGAGFIGSALVWALNCRGIREIVITDFLDLDKRRDTSEADIEQKRRNLKPLEFTTYVEADVFRRRIAQNPTAFGQFSTVFHLGACSSTTETDRAYLDDNNFRYTLEMAEWALTQRARFIYASSAATYGDGTAGMDDKNDDLTRLQPLNLYGLSKHRFDMHAQQQGWFDRIVGVKYFNVFGPNEDHKGYMRSLVHKAYQQILETGQVQLFRSHRPDYKDGEQKRDFLYVKDAIEMTIHFADRGVSAGGLFNLGSGQANTWIELANSIFAALGHEPKIDFINMPVTLRKRYQYFTQADISKLRASEYDRPITPLNEAVRDYVQNYLVPGKKLGE